MEDNSFPVWLRILVSIGFLVPLGLIALFIARNANRVSPETASASSPTTSSASEKNTQHPVGFSGESDKTPVPSAFQPESDSYNSKLLEKLQFVSEHKTGVLSIGILPKPSDQEIYIESMNNYRKGLSFKSENGLREMEIRKQLEDLKQLLGKPYEFRRWLVQIDRIEVVDDKGQEVRVVGVLSLVFPKCNFKCAKPDTIAVLRDLQLPTVVELDGEFLGQMHDFGDSELGHLLEFEFRADEIRPILGEAGIALVEERIQQEKMATRQ